MNIPTGDLIWGIIGFLLSILVFSYLIGDNPLFRFAIHLFIGVSAGVVCGGSGGGITSG
jgi:predicted membrane protein